MPLSRASSPLRQLRRMMRVIRRDLRRHRRAHPGRLQLPGERRI